MAQNVGHRGSFGILSYKDGQGSADGWVLPPSLCSSQAVLPPVVIRFPLFESMVLSGDEAEKKSERHNR